MRQQEQRGIRKRATVPTAPKPTDLGTGRHNGVNVVGFTELSSETGNKETST